MQVASNTDFMSRCPVALESRLVPEPDWTLAVKIRHKWSGDTIWCRYMIWHMGGD